MSIASDGHRVGPPPSSSRAATFLPQASRSHAVAWKLSDVQAWINNRDAVEYGIDVADQLVGDG